MAVNVGIRRHLSSDLPCLTRRDSVNASKWNILPILGHTESRVAQRRALHNISHVVCNSSTSQADGWRSGTATSWAVELNRNIVIAVDASEDSIAAFEWALRNLYRPGDAIHILHVVPALRDAPASGSLYYPRYDPVGCEQSLWSQAEQFIQDEFVAVAQERGITANIVLVKESKGHDIGQVVCQEAEKLSASPLVMYSHQKSRMEEFFLGSVSKYCATACKRPVLLVHPAQAYGS